MASLKQKTAFVKAVENGGNMSRAMIAAGYSKATAKTPQKLTKSKAWRELSAAYLPDELLAYTHRQLLESRDPATGELDASTVSRALDMAYKIKGRYKPSPSENQSVFEVKQIVIVAPEKTKIS